VTEDYFVVIVFCYTIVSTKVFGIHLLSAYGKIIENGNGDIGAKIQQPDHREKIAKAHQWVNSSKNFETGCWLQLALNKKVYWFFENGRNLNSKTYK
jgi:hypothetical protein